MKFGVGFSPGREFEDVLWGVKRADELGFDFVGIFDSPYNWMDVYPFLGVCARETSRVRLGPYITNPLTRHPSVTASAIATVNVISGGRAYLAIGRGDSAVKQLGWKPAPWKVYEQAVRDMRSWMRGEPVDVEGAPTPLELKFAREEIPISLGVFGPRGARAAGKLADCATTECAELGAVKWFADVTRETAQSLGREVEFEVSIASYVSDDMGKARDMCRYEPEMLGNLIWHLMRTYPVEELPPSLVRGFEHLASESDQWQKYNWDDHAAVADAHKQVVTDEMVDRFCVLGSVQNCVEKLRELEKLGVDSFCAYLLDLGREEVDAQLRLWAERIIPELSGSTATVGASP